jgi:hypothetical protein
LIHKTSEKPTRFLCLSPRRGCRAASRTSHHQNIDENQTPEMEFPPSSAWLSNVVKLHPIVAPRNTGAQRDYIILRRLSGKKMSRPEGFEPPRSVVSFKTESQELSRNERYFLNQKGVALLGYSRAVHRTMETRMKHAGRDTLRLRVFPCWHTPPFRLKGS